MKLLPAKPLHAAALCLALAWSALPLAGVAQDNAMKPTVAGNGGIESALVASLVEVIESRVDDALNRWQIVYEGSPEVLHQTVARKHPANKRASAKRTVTRRS